LSVDEDDRDVLPVARLEFWVGEDVDFGPADAQICADLVDNIASVLAEMATGLAEQDHSGLVHGPILPIVSSVRRLGPADGSIRGTLAGG
jgi:hypothetical protein